MLADKGYYDYDYSRPKEKAELTPEDREIWSKEKLDSILGVKRKQNQTLSPEEAQKIVMEEIDKKSKND